MSLRPAAAIVMLALSGPRADAACAPMKRPQVSVDVSADPVETVFDTSLDELQRLATAAGKQAHMPLRAVYGSKVLFGAAIRSETESISPEEVCIVGVRVAVRIRVSEKMIHAAREIRDSTCLLRASVDHAMAHARHQERSLSAAREHMADALREMLREYRPPPLAAAKAEHALSQAISKHVDAELAAIDADRTQSARALDSPEALSRLRHACNGETKPAPVSRDRDGA